MLRSTIVYSLLVSFLSAPLAFAQSRDEATPTKQVEEIVVTARKRAELLEDTPVAISVLGQSALRDSNITRINEIQNLVPNLTFVQGLSGGAPLVRIRGVGTTTAETAFDPGVGFYVDGVFLARAVGQLLDTVDIAQVEVLRGPQGTVFGKNTVGGAVSITTVKPRFEHEGSVQVRAGNFNTVNARGMINLPIWEDVMAARFAVSTQNTEGYVRNIRQDSRMSDGNSIDFIGSVRILPTESLTIDVSGQYSYLHSASRGGECVFVGEGAVTSLAPGFEEACRSTSGPFVSDADSAQINEIESSGVWAVLKYEAGAVGPLDDLSFKSLTSWRRQQSRARFDLDASGFPAIQLSSVGDGGLFDSDAPQIQRQIQQELQVNASAWDDRINLVGGFFGYWEKAGLPTTVRAVTDAFVTLTSNRIDTDNFTWALYGQGTVDVTDWLSVTGGVRYTADRKTFDQIALDPRTPEVPPSTGSDANTFKSWTPMGTVALTMPQEWLDGSPVEHLMGYFTYSRGFKGGGFNAILQSQVGSLAPDAFNPETLDNFEIGLKTIAFDQRLTLNVAAFHGKYDDIQVAQFITEIGDDDMVISRRVTQNAAEATTEGFEFEVMAQPLPGLVVTGSFGFIDARFDDYPDAENQIDTSRINRAGQTFDLTPSYQSFLSIQYTVPVELPGDDAFNGQLTPRVEWSYRDRVHTVAPEIDAGVQPGYHLLGARLTYDFLDDRAQFALWAKNLLDEEYFQESFAYVTTFGGVSRFFLPPRTYGVELSYRF